MAAHRFWRFVGVRTQGGNMLVIAGLKMRETPSGPDLVPANVTASSTDYGSPRGALTSGWGSATYTYESDGSASSGSPQWLLCDFGAGGEDLAEIVMSYPDGGFGDAGTCFTELKVQYSDDGITFTTQRKIVIYAFDPWKEGDVRTFDVTPSSGGSSTGLVIGQKLVSAPNPPAMPGTPRYIPGSQPTDARVERHRYYQFTRFGGEYMLAGATTVLNNPAAKHVRLYDQLTGALVREQYTGDDGRFEFRNLSKGPWTVVGIDDTKTYNGVIYTYVDAVPM